MQTGASCRPYVAIFHGLRVRDRQTIHLAQAVQTFEGRAFQFGPHACRKWAQQFGEERFKREFAEVMERAAGTPGSLIRVASKPFSSTGRSSRGT